MLFSENVAFAIRQTILEAKPVSGQGTQKAVQCFSSLIACSQTPLALRKPSAPSGSATTYLWPYNNKSTERIASQSRAPSRPAAQ